MDPSKNFRRQDTSSSGHPGAHPSPAGQAPAGTGNPPVPAPPHSHPGGFDNTSPLTPAQTLAALKDQLQAIGPPSSANVKEVLEFFRAFKAAESSIKTLLRQPGTTGLGNFTGNLMRFLEQLNTALHALPVKLPSGASAQDVRLRRAANLDVSLFDMDGIHDIFLGLSLCADPTGGIRFSKEQADRIHRPLQAITDTLLDRAVELGWQWPEISPDKGTAYATGGDVDGLLQFTLTSRSGDLSEVVDSSGKVVNMLNWLSRGLKANLLVVSEPIREAFQAALPVLHQWLGGNQQQNVLSTYQLSKCAVQIDTMLNPKYRLIELDPATERGAASRELVAQCIQRLCSADVLRRLESTSVEVVPLTNICNVVKNAIDMGVVAATDKTILSGLEAQARLIAKIPSAKMLEGDCRTLANFANFLRTIGEKGVPARPAFDTANRHVIACIQMLGKEKRPSGQAVSNLISFVKFCDKQLDADSTQPADADTKQKMQDDIKKAAGQLTTHLLACGIDEFSTPESLSGLLAGFSYFLQEELIPSSKEAIGFLKAAVNSLPDIKFGSNDKSRSVALLALRQMLDNHLIDFAGAKPALLHLLGMKPSSKDQAIQTRMAQVIQHLAAAERPAQPQIAAPDSAHSANASDAAGPSIASDASEAPATQPQTTPAPQPKVIPGLTRIIAPTLAGTTTSTTNTTATCTTSTLGVTSTTPATTSGAKVTASGGNPKTREWQDVPEGRRAHRNLPPVSTSTTPVTTSIPLSAVMSQPGTPRQETSKPAPPAKSATPRPQTQPPKHQQKKAGGKKGNAPAATTGKSANLTPQQRDWFQVLGESKMSENQKLDKLKTLARNTPSLVNTKNANGEPSALYLAIESGSPSIVAWLMESGHKPEGGADGLLSKVCTELLLDAKVLKAIDVFLKATELGYGYKLVLKEHFAKNPPPEALHEILLTHGLVEKNVEKPQAPTAAKKFSRQQRVPQSEQLPQLRVAPPNTTNDMLLRKAVFQGDAAPIELMLAQPGIDVNQRDRYGATPLMIAVNGKQIAAIKLLLNQPGIDVNQPDNVGTTPLILAVQGGNIDVVALLLDQPGVNVNQPDIRGIAPLLQAVCEGNRAVVKLLLAYPGIEIGKPEQNGVTPLKMAVSKGDTDVVELLLKAATPSDDKAALKAYFAKNPPSEATYEILLAHGLVDAKPIVKPKAPTATRELPKSEKNPRIDNFLKSLSTGTERLLRQAAFEGQTAAIEALLEQPGIDVNQPDSDGATPLLLAVQEGHENIVRLLLKHKASVNLAGEQNGLTPLALAAAFGHKAVVELLLGQPGIEIDKPTGSEGYTALHCATEAGQEGTISLLLKHKASVNLASVDGTTPLMKAAAEGHKTIVSLLLKHGASVNLANIQYGTTPLLIAVIKGDEAMVELLLTQPGIEINKPDKSGTSPLSLAQEEGNKKIIELLLARGARLD